MLLIGGLHQTITKYFRLFTQTNRKCIGFCTGLTIIYGDYQVRNVLVIEMHTILMNNELTSAMILLPFYY